MNIPRIEFTRIRSLGSGGQRDGYEQFICRQVAQEREWAQPPSHLSSPDGARDLGGRCRTDLV
ncbi:hypothetical protein Skr01_54170 [Sphaerisporangium krabiense]|nr:hypothetical protein Skr01_54170 [Sphaerisporangium krabiense]